MWFYIKLCQLHEGTDWLIHSISPWNRAWHVNAYHRPGPVLNAPYVLTQVNLPTAYMGGSASF